MVGSIRCTILSYGSQVPAWPQKCSWPAASLIFRMSEAPPLFDSEERLICNMYLVRRDDARRVLAAIALELGPGYMPQIATALSSALPPKGYTAQILGYTFNTILTAACQVCCRPCLCILQHHLAFMMQPVFENISLIVTTGDCVLLVENSIEDTQADCFVEAQGSQISYARS